MKFWRARLQVKSLEAQLPEWICNALRDAQSIFQGVGFYEWHLLDDRVTWSAGLLEIYGVETAPASEPEFTALVHPEDRTRVEAETTTFMGEGDVYAHEFRIVRPDGGIRYVHDRGVIQRGKDGRARVLRGLNIDITEQVVAGNAHGQGTEERLRPVLSEGRFGLYDLDVPSGRSYWSPSLLQLLGREREEMPSSLGRALEGLHPYDRRRAKAEMQAALSRVGPYQLTYRLQRPNGDVVWVRDHGETFGPIDVSTGRARRAIGFVEDITGARNLERRSYENQQRLELAYSISGIAAFDVDLRTNTSHWSPNLYKLLGLSKNRMASPDLFFQHVHPDDVAQLRALYETAISAGTLFQHEFRVIRADGALRHLAGVGRVIEEVDGDPRRMIGVNYDITDRKVAEERMQMLMHEVNHREKNLLSLVQAIARQTRNGDHEQYLEQFFARLRSLAASQSLLIDQSWSGVDLYDLARSQLNHFSDLIDSRLIIDGPFVSLAPAIGQTIGMALHELATNAAKYGALAEPEGRVELKWRRYRSHDDEPRFSISWREFDGPRVVSPERTGFGTVILDKMMRSTLGGEVELSYLSDGLWWCVDCPEARLYADLQ